MPRINLSYQEGGQAIKAVGDVFRGWQEWEKGFGYFGRGFLEFRGGWKITVDLQVRARPNYLAGVAKEFPRNLSAHYGDPKLYYSLEDYKLIGYCNLASHLRLLENCRKPNLLGPRQSDRLERVGQLLRYSVNRVQSDVAFLQ